MKNVYSFTGEKGFAFTLITDKDKEFAGALVRNLEDANQHVPKPLLDLANQVGIFSGVKTDHFDLGAQTAKNEYLTLGLFQ